MVHANPELWTTVGPFSDKLVDVVQDFVLPRIIGGARLTAYADGVNHAVASRDIINLLSLVDSNRQLVQLARIQSLSSRACRDIKELFSSGVAFQALRYLYLETHRLVAWKEKTLLAPSATFIRLCGMRSAPSLALCTELSELHIENVDELPADAVVVINALRLRRMYLNVRSMQEALDTAAEKDIQLSLPCLKVATLFIHHSDLYRLFALCSANGLSSLTSLSLHGHCGGTIQPVQVIEDRVIQQGLQALVATIQNTVTPPTFLPSHLLHVETQIDAVDVSLMSVLRHTSQERRVKLSMDTTYSHPSNVDMHVSVMAGILSAIGPLRVDKRLHVRLMPPSRHPFERDPVGGLSSMWSLTAFRLSGDIAGVRAVLKALAQGRGTLRTHMILDGFTLTRDTLAHLCELASRRGNRIVLSVIGDVEESCKTALIGHRRLQVGYRDV
ncbi:unnamed protein product [Peniophora sp. CBMAI 1063]|nr:unnamed protein product [Peniophora sp. CBMAI 1063]